MRDLDYWHGARFNPGSPEGHYESWFLRANHPGRNEAFWIRYTIISPAGKPEEAIGELWAIHFDGEQRRIVAAKREVPIAECSFAKSGLDVTIADARLTSGALTGWAEKPGRIRWVLHYRDGGLPMVFLPENLYEGRLPKAKAVTPRPFVLFGGTLEVDGREVALDGWVGSENHNWGSQHTDTYAWGQVVGFDDAPDVFLEAVTARLKFGPIWTPHMTIATMRVGDRDYRFNRMLQAFRAKGGWSFFDWSFDTAGDGARLRARFRADREDFVGLTYYNPPGGTHTCLNSKVAGCEVVLERPGEPELRLTTQHRAAFEILTDEIDHNVPMAT